MLNKNVYDALCIYGIKKFFTENGVDYKDTPNKYDLIPLLSSVDDTKLIPFLINGLSYGLQRNIYISKIKTFSFPLDIEHIHEYIKNLGFKNCNLVNDDYIFTKDIKNNFSIHEKSLVHYNLNLDDNNNVTSVDLLIGEGFKDSSTEEEFNLYYSICIDIINKILIIRLRNFETKFEDYSVDNTYLSLKDELRRSFGIIIEAKDTHYMQLMYNAVSDLTDTILKTTYNEISSKIGDSIDSCTDIWNNMLENNLTAADKTNLKNSIIYSYCKIQMRKELKEISVYKLKEVYDVDGYARSVHFIDDSVSRINTKSKSVEESLLDTSSFYDIKSSLDHSKSIKKSNIHWIIGQNNRLNTTFINESGGRFKVIINSNHFNKEVDNYVLQKVIKYSPK